ncbi:hypothetical protein BA059_23500 [Mycolicibacterium sp. (ex Dasyatis americana)]|uniref:Uncharacterized protein n=2 Tax=Mycobacterium TaxID=1763 RepID=A0A1A3CRS7_MYCAS|nr:hypothetical protein A5752_06125 [Mycobacterium sp. 852002-51961_SCH5331710]OBI89570.1 hypothetical protein A5661_03900 [Mycobacterium asiaticum]OBJ78863.1 hypothetical protein A9W97_03105 [Mycobacterium gordonae]OBK78370.1 hypothetical protein A5650_11025 [Mycobacterium sp. 1164985.4]OFB36478.1 hypothetical protein BA059_23500 [Mycolicibacterium sp. (ex Dasyatis americana)]OHU07821.1 hypothetical protein BKG61_00125 [Mycobacterium syngnathidarum]ORW53314.1 hypothetical protein AWC21_28365
MNEVVAGGLVTAHAHHQDDVQGTVGVAIASPIEPVADRFAAGGFQWADPAEFGESGVAADPSGVVAEGGQQRGSGVGPDAVARVRRWR